MVVTAVVHYTRLARVARGRNSSVDDGIFACFTSLPKYVYSYLRLLFT